MQLLALALLLGQVVAIPAPDGGTVQADAALALGLTLLATLDEGRPLVPVETGTSERRTQPEGQLGSARPSDVG